MRHRFIFIVAVILAALMSFSAPSFAQQDGYDHTWSPNEPMAVPLSNNTCLTQLVAQSACSVSCGGGTMVLSYADNCGNTSNMTEVCNTQACAVTGACSSTEWGCAAGTAFNGSTTGYSEYWYCSGANGGANSGQCSYGVPTVGYCGGSEWTCDDGTAFGGSIANYSAYWYCSGINGGGTSAQCSYAIPTAGQCSGSEWDCNVGTPNNGSISGYTAYWYCAGPNGGANTACSYAIPTAGACSSSEWSCDAGTAFGGWIGGGYANWYCAGANGGGNSGQCQFTEPGGPPTSIVIPILTSYGWYLNVMPGQTIPAVDNPYGTYIATIAPSGGNGPYSCYVSYDEIMDGYFYMSGMNLYVQALGGDFNITCTDSWGGQITEGFHSIFELFWGGPAGPYID